MSAGSVAAAAPEVARPAVLGYPDRFSVAPGETIEFKISCAGAGEFRADVVRLRNGDTNPAGPGFLEQVVPTPASGSYPARTQEIRTGSAVLVRDGGGLALGGSGTVRCYVQPTTPALRDQALVSRWDEATRTGWWVGLSGGRLTLRLGSGTSVHETATDAPLYAWTWYAITASWHGGSTEITQRTVAHHIEHILDKLGASSRTAAARRAVEDGLRLLP